MKMYAGEGEEVGISTDVVTVPRVPSRGAEGLGFRPGYLCQDYLCALPMCFFLTMSNSCNSEPSQCMREEREIP